MEVVYMHVNLCHFVCQFSKFNVARRGKSKKQESEKSSIYEKLHCLFNLFFFIFSKPPMLVVFHTHWAFPHLGGHS